ncbi:uncharacterized protein C8A04DRAFT_15476 [Dichotomopilus funicola]|uniref:Uncharacterized protein n=1 Tax=Dichotomopilus funicola TaxID=1934379 RepID=A0AAN6UV89_9PEZI|nr:hypothetical protein C8A04DRAFT_15476 [Dichotomopilus funicola]
MAASNPNKPDLGDILMVIHDFQARSSDELTLTKGDRVELLERDDEFGDGWYLGKHTSNGNSGLFPEVYTRPIPKNSAAPHVLLPTKLPVAPLAETTNQQTPRGPSPDADHESNSTQARESQPVPIATLSLDSSTISSSSSPPYSSSLPQPSSLPPSSSSVPATAGSGLGNTTRPGTSGDSHVLHETLNVIDEHITDFNSPQPNASSGRNGNDSGSEYSSHMGNRISYIQGEETDEEEEGAHTRAEVESWNADQVAEYLFTAGVEKHHCEVFRDQEITGEVILGMDQTSVFIKALDLGSVGRRLKTWQKIKQLQDEVNGTGFGGLSTGRNTQNYGSDAGSDAGRVRSRTNTITSSNRFTPIHETIGSTKRGSQSNSHHSQPSHQQNQHNPHIHGNTTPKMEPYEPGSPASPQIDLGRAFHEKYHEKRPSAASVRDLHHSRRHSSTDFRGQGSPLSSSAAVAPPKPSASSTGLLRQDGAPHKKQPSFDRNWTLGAAAGTSPRPLSSAGHQDDETAEMELTGGVLSGNSSELQDSAVDMDRGYFSGPDVEGRRRNLLKKRESGLSSSSSPKASYTEEQRMRSATGMSRHSRLGSTESMRESAMLSPAAQKYYGVPASKSKRTSSMATTDSLRHMTGSKENVNPTVTRLDSNSSDHSQSQSQSQARSSPKSAIKRLSQVHHPDFNVSMMLRSGLGGLRAASDAITGGEKAKLSPIESPVARESPTTTLYSPARTGSSTPSKGASFDLESPDATKSPSTATTATGATATTSTSRTNRKKTKQETSAYTRGLQAISPREAMKDADYSGWMKKRNANLMTTWKPRLFVLKGRRLAYYYSEDDDQERGLIDISFHRVLPADNERLTGLHATLTGVSSSPAMPAGSHMTTLAEADAGRDPTAGLGGKDSDNNIFIFKLVPPRAGLSRAVNFTKPTVHYFAVPNLTQGRLWMAALMKATIDRDDSQPITSTYQQETISLAKARKMRHRPPALMGLEENAGDKKGANGKGGDDEEVDDHGLGIYSGGDLEKFGLQPHPESARGGGTETEKNASVLPQSA